MSDNSLARVNYYDQQFLRLADLVDEQAYHIGMHRRHNLAAHTWGIIYGLELTLDADKNPVVNPGLAVDGYGREIILPYTQPLDGQAFDQKSSDSLDLYLVYAQEEIESPITGMFPCPPPGSSQPHRRLEVGRLEIRRAELDPITDPNSLLPERRQPPDVPAADLQSDPTRALVDDSSRLWPVFLGKITRSRARPPQYVINQDGRPYAGLIGEYVRAPSGNALVQIGADGRLSRETANLRFAVYLPETTGEKSRPRLAIDKDGDLTLRADSTVQGDVLVDGGAVEFGVGIAYDAANPWSMYHVGFSSEELGEDKPAEDHLRIEMGHSETNPGNNRVSIGHWSEQEQKWVPCLEIYDDCKVNIYGTLIAKDLKVDQIIPVQAQALVLKDRIVDEEKLQSAVDALSQSPAYRVGALSRLEISRLASTGSALDTPIEVILDQLEQDAKRPEPVILPVFAEMVSKPNLRPIFENILKQVLGPLAVEALRSAPAVVEEQPPGEAKPARKKSRKRKTPPDSTAGKEG